MKILKNKIQNLFNKKIKFNTSNMAKPQYYNKNTRIIY